MEKEATQAAAQAGHCYESNDAQSTTDENDDAEHGASDDDSDSSNGESADESEKKYKKFSSKHCYKTQVCD